MLAAEVRAALSKLEPFKSGPLEGVRVAPSLYVVKSYGAPVAIAGQDDYMVTYQAQTATSGRHAGQARAAWRARGYTVRAIPRAELEAAAAAQQ